MNRFPLQDRTILVTRARSQSSVFSSALEDLGANVIEIPTIVIQPLSSAELDSAIRELPRYDWLLFTSTNGVRIFFERVKQLFPGSLGGLPRICSIGPATTEQVRKLGLRVDLQPKLFQAEGVIEAFSAAYSGNPSGLRILLPRARVAREVLPEKLREQGVRIDVIPVYETKVPPESAALIRSALEHSPPDLITFTSSSTVFNFVALVEGHYDLGHYPCAAIGPITADAAEEKGFRVVVQPKHSTIPDLVDAVKEHFTGTSETR